MSFLKTPKFWYECDNAPFCRTLLSPLSALYSAGQHAHKTLRPAPKRAKLPVICVGNLVAGGAGKTPTAIAITKLLQKNAKHSAPFFLTRGYKRQGKDTLRVDPARHSWRDVGDEPLLLAQSAPVIVSPSRPAGAAMAAEQGAGILIMDDGLQNYSLHQDVRILVVDGAMGFGNGKPLPAGPLREPLSRGFHEIDCCILIGKDRLNAAAMIPPDVPVFKASLEVSAENMPDKSARYLAFAGLGYPQKFFDYCRNALGLNVVKTISYPDHHPYSAQNVQTLLRAAEENKAQLLTTEKDMTRLDVLNKANKINVLPVTLHIEDEDILIALLQTKLESTAI